MFGSIVSYHQQLTKLINYLELNPDLPAEERERVLVRIDRLTAIVYTIVGPFISG